MRCDATKPACTACKRSAAAHGEDPECVVVRTFVLALNRRPGRLVICEYEDDDVQPASGEPPKPKKASAKIAALEEKIGASRPSGLHQV